LPYGKERIILCEDPNFDIKETFEKMAISPERKIFVKTKNGQWGIITLSDIFNILNIDV
jgi:hypothetical protein